MTKMAIMNGVDFAIRLGIWAVLGILLYFRQFDFAAIVVHLLIFLVLYDIREELRKKYASRPLDGEL